MLEKQRHVAFAGVLYFLLALKFCVVCGCMIATIYCIVETAYDAADTRNPPTGGFNDPSAPTMELMGILVYLSVLGIAVADFIAIIGIFYWKIWALCLHGFIMLACILATISAPLVMFIILIEFSIFIGSLFIGNKEMKAWRQLEM